MADVPIAGTVYENEHEQAIVIAPLTGSHYLRDNEKVYGIIKILVLEGPGHAYVMEHDRSKNGRAAWLALKAHHEGASFQNHFKEEAYAKLLKSPIMKESGKTSVLRSSSRIITKHTWGWNVNLNQCMKVKRFKTFSRESPHQNFKQQSKPCWFRRC